MRQEYIILKKPQTTAAFNPLAGAMRSLIPMPGMLSAPEAPMSMTSEPKIEVEELDFKGVARTRQIADVSVVAPNMPVKLIEPVNLQPGASAGNAAQGNNTWGVEAVKAHTSPLDGAGITVAVLDTGIDSQHPAFQGLTIEEKDFTGDGNGDVQGHGTHCAGTAFGRDVNGRRIGVAPGVSRVLIGKVLDNSGRGGTEWSLRAVQWAAQNGASVISMSLGIDYPGYVKRLTDFGYPTDLATSFALEGYRSNILAYETLAAYLNQQASFMQSVIIVAAAGNENRVFQNPDWDILAAPPAVAEGLYAVGAVAQGPNGWEHATFSNSGANISAPGVNVESAQAGSQGTVSWNGTSMATPHVAGVTALWAQWLQNRNLLNRPLNLTTKVIGSATLAGVKPGTDSADIGLGIVQAPQTA